MLSRDGQMKRQGSVTGSGTSKGPAKNLDIGKPWGFQPKHTYWPNVNHTSPVYHRGDLPRNKPRKLSQEVPPPLGQTWCRRPWQPWAPSCAPFGQMRWGRTVARSVFKISLLTLPRENMHFHAHVLQPRKWTEFKFQKQNRDGKTKTKHLTVTDVG